MRATTALLLPTPVPCSLLFWFWAMHDGRCTALSGWARAHGRWATPGRRQGEAMRDWTELREIIVDDGSLSVPVMLLRQRPDASQRDAQRGSSRAPVTRRKGDCWQGGWSCTVRHGERPLPLAPAVRVRLSAHIRRPISPRASACPHRRADAGNLLFSRGFPAHGDDGASQAKRLRHE